MNIFNAISEWKQGRYDKKLLEMKELGKCPDCNGRGYILTMSSLYIPSFESIFDCSGCNASGQYKDWENAANENIIH